MAMPFLTKVLTGTARSYFAGNGSKFIFKPVSAPVSQEMESLNLYIHIPFCRNKCPYCPYNKIEYDKNLVAPYLAAMLSELRLYREAFGRFKISSIYIGGGTPTLLIDEIKAVIDKIKGTFILSGDICLETNPNDITGALVKKIKDAGIQLVSIGIQSFHDKNLCFIGRDYKAAIIDEKMRILVNAGFKSVNMDMIFALPGQDIGNLKYDLERSVNTGANQITTYPLFTFPYSTIGRYLKLKNVRMPGLKKRREMYYYINDYLNGKGFARVSVWGFKKGDAPRYSSVTRDNYVGLGAGAGSHMPDGFYLNTFSVKDYIDKCSRDEFPSALCMKFNEAMQSYFWLYWRFYDTCISKTELKRRFSPKDRGKVDGLMTLFKTLGLTEEDDEVIRFNLRGAFWIHLMQNYFSLNYINRIWAVAMKEPFPDKIAL